MKKLIFSINIYASEQKVWNIMLSPDTYREWAAASWPGSFYKGNWAEGEKISFVSDNGSGTLALIQELKLYEYISAVHIAILLSGGVEDIKSDLAKSWVGITEQYKFKAGKDTTDLTVEINAQPQWEKMFSDGWPNALKKLKEICER